MQLSLTLLLAAVAPAAATGDLSFQAGRLDAWQGKGFYATTDTGCGPTRTFGVCSSDDGRSGRKAILHQTFVIPYGVVSIRFSAAAVRKKGCEPGPALDVMLEVAGRTYWRYGGFRDFSKRRICCRPRIIGRANTFGKCRPMLGRRLASPSSTTTTGRTVTSSAAAFNSLRPMKSTARRSRRRCDGSNRRNIYRP